MLKNIPFYSGKKEVENVGKKKEGDRKCKSYNTRTQLNSFSHYSLLIYRRKEGNDCIVVQLREKEQNKWKTQKIEIQLKRRVTERLDWRCICEEERRENFLNSRTASSSWLSSLILAVLTSSRLFSLFSSPFEWICHSSLFVCECMPCLRMCVYVCRISSPFSLTVHWISKPGDFMRTSTLI